MTQIAIDVLVVMRLLNTFSALAKDKRIESFGKSPITPQEIMQQDVNNICIFLRRIGRLENNNFNHPISSNPTNSQLMRAPQQTGQSVDWVSCHQTKLFPNLSQGSFSIGISYATVFRLNDALLVQYQYQAQPLRGNTPFKCTFSTPTYRTVKYDIWY